MKRILITCLLVCILFALMAAGVYAADPIQNARSISTGSEITDNLSAKDDANYYKFTLNKAGYFALSFKHDYVDSSSRCWTVTIYDSNNDKYISYDFNGNSSAMQTFDRIGAAAGTYYIKVEPNYYNYSSVTYRLKVDYTAADNWETEFNDTFSTANALSANTEKNGSTMTKEDSDFYRISLSRAGYISLSFRHDYVETSSRCWTVTLYNSNNDKYVSYDYNGNSSAAQTTNQIGVAAGTYYLKVEPNYYNYSPVSYGIKVNHTAADDWETEFNDAFSTANALSANAEKNGSTMTKEDSDFYIINLNRAGYISLSFRHDYVETSSRCWTITLYDSNNDKYVSYDFNGNSSALQTTDRVGIAAGTYYLKVEPNYYNYSPAKYAVKLNYTAADNWETEFNDSFAAANQLPVNVEKNGSAMTKDDNDYYHFYLNKSGNVVFSFQHDYVETSSRCWTMRVYNSNNDEISSFDYIGKDTAAQSYKGNLGAGDYYLKIEPNRYNYSSAAYSVVVITEGATPPTPSTSFTDVASGSWYADYVEWAVQNGITNGTSATTFSPNADCTRAQIVTFLWRAAGEPSVSGSNPFRDVKSSDYFYKAVLWAVKRGITNGTSGTTFSPGQGCTRAQVVTFFWRAAGAPSPRSGASTFRDVQNTSVYYYRAVLWAYENSVVNGMSEGIFSPDYICTRAQIVTILGRYYG